MQFSEGARPLKRKRASKDSGRSRGSVDGGSNAPAPMRRKSVKAASLHALAFNPTTLEFPGYHSLSPVVVSGDIISLRAKSSARNDIPVFLKFSVSSAEHFSARVESEGQILTRLLAAGVEHITHFLALESHAKYGLVLVCHDQGEIMLPATSFYAETVARIEKGLPAWDDQRLSQFYNIALQLVRLVGTIHQQHIRHGGLRTAVTSLEADGKTVRIGDFHFAYQWEEESPREAGMREDVLPYIAPEATGRQSRISDKRADFYAIGAIFHELLASQPPFLDSDHLELIHQVITRQAPLVSMLEPSVPEPLARVVEKLLEKSPVRRYQSVEGLLADLERLAAGRDVEIGRIDSDACFEIPTTLYARDDEAAALAEAFERVRNTGRGELALVKGVSGVGKSVLVATLQGDIAACHGCIARAKFQQFQTTAPLFAIASALDGLVRRILSEPESVLQQWRDRLQTAIGSEGSMLASFLPLIELLFGAGWLARQPPIPDLPPDQANAKLEALVKTVFRVFARPGQPLLIILDDLQWGTSLDMDFIASILAERKGLNMLICCIWRSNEVGGSHLISVSLLPRVGQPDLSIDLEPFGLSHVIDFAGDVLHRDVQIDPAAPTERVCTDEVRKLAELIMSRSAGNPFFAHQILKSLHQANLLLFDFASLQWTWSMPAILEANLSVDVVDLLVAQIGKLAPDTQEALKVAAALGAELIDAVYLARALDRPVEAVLVALDEALKAGLLQVGLPDLGEHSTPGTHRHASPGLESDVTMNELEEVAPMETGTDINANCYRFIHDRVQQAAYSLVPSASLNNLHYAIGCRLRRGLSDAELSEQAFDLCAHLNYGVELALGPHEREELAKMNVVAGRTALRMTAARSALGYLIVARDLLGPSSWNTAYDLASSCYTALIDAEYAGCNYTTAQSYTEFCLKHVKTDIERLKLYQRSVRCATGTGDAPSAVRIGFEGLTFAGVTIPLNSELANAYADNLADRVVLNEAQIAELANLPVCQQPIIEEAHAIIAALVPPVYFTRPDLLRSMIFKSIHMTMEHGTCPPGTAQFVTQGLLLADEQPRIAHAFGRLALSLLDDSHPLACSAYKIFASHIQVWNEPIRATLVNFRKAISLGIAQHNAEYTAYGSAELIAYSLLGSEDLRGLEPSCRSYATLLNRFGQDISSLYLAIVHQVVLNLRGHRENPVILEGTAFRAQDVETLEARPLILHLFVHAFLSIQLAIIFGDWDRARSLLPRGRKYQSGAPGIVFEAFFSCAEAVALMDDFEKTDEEDRRRIRQTIQRFKRLSDNEPTNFLCSLRWLQAEEGRALRQSPATVHLLYDQAIEESSKQGCLHRAAIMNERCASFLGRPKLAAGYIIEAERLWRKWGCDMRADQLIARNRELFPLAVSTHVETAPLHQRRPSLVPELSSPKVSPLVEFNNKPLAVPSEHGISEPGWDPAALQFAHRPVAADGATRPSPSDGRTSSSELVGSMRKRQSHNRTHSYQPPAPARALDVASLDSESIFDLQSAATSSIEKRSALGVELDMKTVLRASLVISEELSVDRVVSRLMALVLRSAGADVCHLILEKGGVLCGEASSTATSDYVQHHRFVQSIDEMSDRFPTSIINFVARTRSVVLNDFDDPVPDPYLTSRPVKSMLCLPLQNHSKLVGVLFLSNDSTTNAFTSDRLELLLLIAAQAASAMERSRLVTDLEQANAGLISHKKDLEQKVEQRTIELRDKNDTLKGQIKEREQAQTELQRARDVAEKATQLKSLFLAQMSHEVRTPFNAIVALSGLLLDTQLTPMQADWVQTIRNSSSELLVVINDVLDLSKIENGSLELQEEPFSLRSCIDGSLELLAEKAAAKNLDLAFVWHQHDEHIVGDIVRLRQIVINYLSNAIKFTDEGQIIVRAVTQVTDQRDEQDRAIVRVRIAVEDTGTGISEQGLTKLFKLYSQVEGADTTSKFGGTGLGLSISKRLCQAMSGSAWAESTLGKGSTFYAEIFCPQASADAVPYAMTALPTFKDKRCLIVDRHEPTRHLLGFVVERMGMTSEAGSSYEEAFEKGLAAYLAGQPFDLIIVDAFLPSFGALQLIKKLRQRGAPTSTIVLTRMGSPVPDELRALSSDFIIKPVKQQTLAATIKRLMTGVSPALPVHVKDNPLSEFPTVAEPSKLRILCVDDNPVNIKVGLTILKRLGYNNVDTAGDGIAALEACAAQRYSVVLMDVQMPRMNGLDATRELCRRHTIDERPYIVAMTANALSGDREKCEEAGMDDYLTKPIQIPALIAKMQQAAKVVAQRTAANEANGPPTPGSSKAALNEYRQRMAHNTNVRRSSQTSSPLPVIRESSAS